MNQSILPDEPPSERIRIVAAVVTDELGRVLVVRKRRTLYFMQPGGKMEPGETSVATLARELNEELGCILVKARHLGVVSAPAANEPGCIVEATLFEAEIAGEINPGSEIEAIAWIEPSDASKVALAPLTQFHVLPLALSRQTKRSSLNR